MDVELTGFSELIADLAGIPFIHIQGMASITLQDVFPEKEGRIKGCLRHVEKQKNAAPVLLVGGHGIGEVSKE